MSNLPPMPCRAEDMPKTERIRLRAKVVTQASFELPDMPAPTQAVPPRVALGKGPRLVVVYGETMHAEYSLHEGSNVLGRCSTESVDIDLTEQEPPHLVWASRRHAAVHLSNGNLEIEDLGSRNGTIVNSKRLEAGQKQILHVHDVIQIGVVRLRVLP
ncbi:MAG: FHA domain-containing protein [Gemmataceae bacterium]